MFNITKEKFLDNYNNNIPQVLTHKIIADTETPVSTLLKISKNEKYSFLLESVEGGDQRGRFSLLGSSPDLIWSVKNKKVDIKSFGFQIPASLLLESNPLKSLKYLIKYSKIENLNEESPYPILVGYLGYSMIQHMEKINLKNPDNLDIPEALMIRPKLVAVFDNIKDTISIMSATFPKKEISANMAYHESSKKILDTIDKINSLVPKTKVSKQKLSQKEINFKSNYTKNEYFKIIQKAKQYIKKGEIFQVVTSQRFETDYKLGAYSFYRSLRRLNPSPFLVYLNFDRFGLVASSPEILVRLRNDEVTIRPIAGTRKRGKNKEDDESLSKELLKDEKELSEHLMLLDLGRNDVGRVSKVGSVKVTQKMIIEYYSHVMHIVSNVIGKIDEKYDAVDALISGFPAGTVSGAPKIRAMEIIEELENLDRSFYGGAMGYFDSKGQMDTCISLRTGLIKNKKLYVQAGGGVVYDSDPEKEYQETLNKANALMDAAKDSYLNS